jgi:hypothetical protein
LRGLIPKREHKASAPRPPATLQPRPIGLRSAKGYWRNWFLLGLLLSAGAAVATAFWFQVGIWTLLTLNQTQTLARDSETDRHPGRADKLKQKEEYRTPHLAFQNSQAAINQPLPLGIALNKGIGGETLVLSGFTEGTSLSVGTALSTTRWSVPGRDLDNAFISAPENFNGTMQVTATLYSSAQDILETKEVRFEWSISQKEDRLAGTDLTNDTSRAVPDVGADDMDRTRFSDVFGLISRHEIDASATGEYSEASARGSSPMWLTMAADWLSQISSVSLPPVDRPFEQSLLVQPLPPSTAALVEKGERLLREGNVSAARPLLRRAADAGRADAALDLAKSFDPSFVPAGATADPAEAARWYKRALKLGHKDVAADLERVTSMLKNTAPK